VTQQLCQDVAAACGGAFPVNYAEAEALDDAADDAGQQRRVRQHYFWYGQKVDEHRGQHHADKRVHNEPESEFLPRHGEKRHVHHNGQDTDRQTRKLVDDHGNTGYAAHHDVIGVQQKFKAGGGD